MKTSIKDTLSKQLISIVVIMAGILFIGLGLVLPKALVPIYEKVIYQTLKEPLEVLGDNVNDNVINTDIGYLYITNNSHIITSDNLSTIIKLDAKQIVKKINSEYGKFNYLGKTYYYYMVNSDYFTKISITDNSYILGMSEAILYKIFPVILLMLLIILALIVLWSRQLIKKIEHLKDKINNLDNDQRR